MIPPPARARSAALLVLLATAACGPRPVERPEFEGGRALVFLRAQMVQGPRYPGHRGHDRALAWLREQLALRADTVVEQPFTATLDGEPRRLTNVLARFGPEKAERVLLVAHRDTRRRAERSVAEGDRDRPIPGANDGASAVAVLVELAELFRQRRPEVGVDLLFTDGDDYGPGAELLGTRRFLEAGRPPGYAPRWAVALNLVGDRRLRVPVPSGEASGPLRSLLTAARAVGEDSLFVAGSRVPVDVGAAELLRAAGIPTLAVADDEYQSRNWVWHTVDDHTRHLSEASLDAVGDVLAEMVYREEAGGAR